MRKQTQKKSFMRSLRYIFDDMTTEDMRLRRLLLAQAISHLRKTHKKRFGLFVIYGWQDKWNDTYADVTDETQDIFAKDNLSAFDPKAWNKISKTVGFDGAILIDGNGRLLHSGIIIEGLSPRHLAEKLYSKAKGSDLSTKLGFKKKVHTRHLSAITASWKLRGTTIFTVSEETGDVHTFENGYIVFSTAHGEVKKRIKK